MSDITCPTCKEPVDTYHLKYDLIWETDLSEKDKNYLSEKGTPLDERGAREALERLGYRFPVSAKTPVLFTRCEYCEDDDATPVDSLDRRSVLQTMLGDDTDGIESFLEE